MTLRRIRVSRDTPASGSFEWAVVDANGVTSASGSSSLERPAVTGECDLVLATDLVLLERVAVPAAQRRRAASALRFLAESSVLPDPERVHVAAAPVSDGQDLALAVIDRDWFAGLRTRLEGAGIFPRRAYPEALLVPHAPGSWTVVLDRAGGFARLAPHEAFALDDAPPGNAPSALRLALAKARELGTAPARIVVRPAGDIALPDLGMWSAQLDVRVEPGPDWRWSEASEQPTLDLLQGEFAPRGGRREWVRRLRRPALLAAALLLLAGGEIALDWWRKAREQRALLEQMASIYREVFGENAPIVDAPLQMSRALGDLRRKAGEPVADDFLVLLGALADRMPDPATHRLESLEFENGVLSVTLRPHDPAQFEALERRLRNGGALDRLDVRVDAARTAGLPALRIRVQGQALPR